MGIQNKNPPKCQLKFTNLSCSDGPVMSFYPTHTTKIVEELPRTKFNRSQWLLLALHGFINFCVGALFAIQAPFFPQESFYRSLYWWISPGFCGLRRGTTILLIQELVFVAFY
ncbi:uncharacterized protein LOC143239569 [Tachypleus tridentatus]|uniref:uncharacterized protein LOC143239569 n=1 Tax=Tachypleus tridentatus TaxID=6853 RepID=UPI003FD32E8B